MWLTIMSNVIAFTDADTNPCMQCGACCAYFRVSFYHGETDSTGGVVPAEMTEKVNDFMACMKGTDQKSPRCINLQGKSVSVWRAALTHNARRHAVSLISRGSAVYTMPPVTRQEPHTACRRWSRRPATMITRPDHRRFALTLLPLFR